MIDRDQLTEAPHLEIVTLCEHGKDHGHQTYLPKGAEGPVCSAGSRKRIDFPTDEQVEAAAKVLYGRWPKTAGMLNTRAGLEAVRRVMFGEGHIVGDALAGEDPAVRQ